MKVNPINSNGSDHVIRGGSWYDNVGLARSALRGWYLPGLRGGNVGVRLVRKAKQGNK